MNETTDAQLEDQSNWDYDNPEPRGPVKAPRVVVSVAFRRDDFERVAKYAERAGKKASEFIREASLEKVSGQSHITYVQGFGNAGTLWFGDNSPSITRVFTQQVGPEHQPVVTSS